MEAHYGLNRKVLGGLEGGGEAFVSNAVIRGRFALRASIVNFRTTGEDVVALPGIVVREDQETDRSGRRRLR